MGMRLFPTILLATAALAASAPPALASQSYFLRTNENYSTARGKLSFSGARTVNFSGTLDLKCSSIPNRQSALTLNVAFTDGTRKVQHVADTSGPCSEPAEKYMFGQKFRKPIFYAALEVQLVRTDPSTGATRIEDRNSLTFYRGR